MKNYYIYLFILLLILNYCLYIKEDLSSKNILAYLSEPSYYKDDTIELKISYGGKCNIHVLDIHPTINEGIKLSINDYKIIYEENNIETTYQSTPKFSFAEGCNWSSNYSFKNDNFKLNKSDLKSDMYIIKIFNESATYYLPLIIKSRTPSTKNIILINTNTWQAYNTFGGATLYRYNIDDKKYKIKNGKISTQLSYNRPHSHPKNSIELYINSDKDTKYKGIHIIYNELVFLRWCKLKDIEYEIITDYDLHYDYNIKSYKNLILCGHPEYWTTHMIDVVYKFQIDNNGNIISLGGNSIYREITINNKNIYPTKNKLQNGTKAFKEDDNKKYINIIKNIVGNVYNQRGFNNYYDYTVKNPSHWIYDGLNLERNSKICKSCKPLGHELDKIIHTTVEKPADGLYNTGLILFNSSIGTGRVFSVGSITYCSCLLYELNLSKITYNVIKNFEE